MTTSQALVETDRAERYLEQFAKHFAHQPGGISAQLKDDGSLLVDFGGASCSMRAAGNNLVLYAEAPAAEELGELQARLVERLEQIGRRDGITVQWNPDFTSAASAEPHRHRRH